MNRMMTTIQARAISEMPVRPTAATACRSPVKRFVAIWATQFNSQSPTASTQPPNGPSSNRTTGRDNSEMMSPMLEMVSATGAGRVG